jgi:hypothetical protein
MIRDFEQWNANIGELSELQELSGCRVGVEAADYLTNRILNSPRAKEPLVPALGGLPLALQQHIEDDLDAFQREGIEPWFVFSGLDITKQDEPFRQKQDEAAVNANAWNLYDSHQAEASVAKFGESSKRCRMHTWMYHTDSHSLRYRRRLVSRPPVSPRKTRAPLPRRTIQRMGPGTSTWPRDGLKLTSHS